MRGTWRICRRWSSGRAAASDLRVFVRFGEGGSCANPPAVIALHQLHQATEKLHARFFGGQRNDVLGHCRDAAQAFPFAGVVGHQVAALGDQRDHVGAEHGLGKRPFKVEAVADGSPDTYFNHAKVWH